MWDPVNQAHPRKAAKRAPPGPRAVHRRDNKGAGCAEASHGLGPCRVVDKVDITAHTRTVPVTHKSVAIVPPRDDRAG